MQLKYDYSVKRRKILIELETSDFTVKECKALDMLGEPVVEFQKTYNGRYTIAISKKLRSEFKVRVRIDGTDDIDSANDAGQQFLRDITQYLRDLMEKLMDDYEDQIFPPAHGMIKISDNH